eukprot:Skav219309  [mRNA]  locus=scaffold1152:30478:33513:+ [translate_table: standard]
MTGTSIDFPPCHSTGRGSRPGSPLADLAFNQLMTALIRQLEELLATNAMLQQTAALLQRNTPVVAWADDIALPLTCMEPTQAVPLLCELMPLIDRVFQDFGLQLNYQQNKTEAVLHLRGRHAPAVKRQLLLDDHALVDLPHGPQLRVVAKYTHLGVAFSQTASLVAEIDARVAKASQAYRQLSRTIFHNRHLPTRLRLQLLEALVLPIVLYGAGAWELLPAAKYRMLDGLITRWQRSIVGCGFWKTSRVTDAAFRAQWDLMSLSLRLAKHRLLFAMQMTHAAPTGVWDVLSQEDDRCNEPWLESLRHALRWCSHEIVDHPLKGSALTTEEIYAWLAKTGPADARALRHLLRRQVLQEKIIHHVAAGYQELIDVCRQCDGVRLADPVPDAEQDELHHDYGCTICHRRFRSIQGQRAHMWRAHGCKTKERSVMNSATCLACGRCYWHPRRLQQHLYRSQAKPNGCYALLVKHLDPLDPAVQLPSECPDTLAADHSLPFVQSFGPLQLPSTTVWQRHHEQRLQMLQFRWETYEFPDAIAQEDKETIFARLQVITHDWLQLYGAMDPDDGSLVHEWLQFLEDFPAGADVGFLGFCLWGQQAMYSFLETLEDVDAIEFVEAQFLETAGSHPMWELLTAFEAVHHEQEPQGDLPVLESVPERRAPVLREPFPRCFRDQEVFLRPLFSQRILDAPGPQPVPLIQDAHGKLHLYILHLFAGRRRVDDCETWAHRLVEEYFGKDVTVHMIAVDTAIHPELCNVLGASYSAMVRLCDLGVFGLSLTGPPCETWTAARHLPTEHPDGKGPRPLRSATKAWGLPLLEYQELRQVDVGSQLYLRSAALELRVQLHGGGGVMEHPRTPEDVSYASVWRTEVQQGFLGQLDAAIICAVNQFQFGASSVKPTNLRALGMDGFLRYIHEEKDTTIPKPQAVLQGYDYFQKAYRTSAAKEYPPALCRALIKASFRALAVRRQRQGDRVLPLDAIPSDLQQWMAAVETANRHAAAFGLVHHLPDYQPQNG